MAEAFYNQLTASKQAASAACEDFRAKYHGKITDEIITTMNEVGIDISGQKMKLLTPEMVDEADKVIVLCDQQFCPDFLLERNDKVIMKTLADPHLQTAAQIATIRDQIKEIVKELI